jgi:hypothetical protein
LEEIAEKNNMGVDVTILYLTLPAKLLIGADKLSYD